VQKAEMSNHRTIPGAR